MKDELIGAVETGDLNEVLTIIDRLQSFLPEYGRTRSDELFAELWKEVDDLTKQLQQKRLRMREEALRIVASVKRNWTAKEIQKACGYQTAE